MSNHPTSPQEYFEKALEFARVGDQYIEENETEQAINQFKLALAECDRSIELDPDFVEAIHLRSKLFLVWNDYDSALADLAHLLTLDLPEVDRAILYYERGDLYFSLEQYEKAFADYQEMVALLPEEPSAYFIRADKYAIWGDRISTEEEKGQQRQEYYELALADCDRSIQLDPDFAEAIRLRSKLFLVLNDYDSALADLAHLLTLDLSEVDRAILYNERGDLYFSQEQFEMAFADYQEMVDLLPDAPDPYYVRSDKYAIWGDRLSAEGKKEKAEAYYRLSLDDLNRSMELGNTSVEALYFRSKLNWALGDLEKVEADLHSMEEKGPSDEVLIEIYNLRGDIFLEKGDYEQAFSWYDKIVALLPDDPQAFYFRGDKHALCGDQIFLELDEEKAREQYQKALADFKKAIELDPLEIEFYLGCNSIYQVLGDWGALEENSNAMISLAPDEYQGYMGKGLALREQNRDEEALEAFNLAIRHSSALSPAEKADIYFGRGITYEKLNNFKAAMLNYQSVVAFTPDDPRGRIGMGNSLISLGNSFDAAQEFSYALDLDETNLASLNGRALAFLGIGDRFSDLHEVDRMLEAYKNALKDVESALSFGGEDLFSWYYKGLALRGLESYSESIKAFDHAISQAKEWNPAMLPTLYFEKGEALRLLGMDFLSEHTISNSRLNDSLQVLNEGLDLTTEQKEDSIRSLILISKGLALTHLGQYREAVSSFEQCLAEDPENLRALTGMGAALYGSGDGLSGQAEAVFLKVLEREEAQADKEGSDLLYSLEFAHIGLGLIYDQNRQFEKAKEEFRRALQMNPRIPEAQRYINQAYMLDDFKAFGKAEEYRLAALRLDSESANHHNEIAWMYVDKFADSPEKLEIALRHGHRAIELEKTNNWNWLDTLGWIYFRMGKYEEAAAYLSQAVVQNNYDELIVFHYDEARKRVGGN